MRMSGVRIGDGRLRRGVSFRPSMECAHPADLMRADPFGCARHSLRTEVGRIGQHAGQHCRDIPWDVACANMREEIRKAGPFMRFPQQVGNLDQRVHIADFGIQFLGGGRNFANGRRDDQGTCFKTNTFELPGPCSVRQALQIEVEHLARFGKPHRAITLDAQSEAILLLHCVECRPRHQMLVDRPEGSAAIDPNVGRSKPISQSRERRNLVETAIRLPGSKMSRRSAWLR